MLFAIIMTCAIHWWAPGVSTQMATTSTQQQDLGDRILQHPENYTVEEGNRFAMPQFVCRTRGVFLSWEVWNSTGDEIAWEDYNISAVPGKTGSNNVQLSTLIIPGIADNDGFSAACLAGRYTNISSMKAYLHVNLPTMSTSQHVDSTATTQTTLVQTTTPGPTESVLETDETTVTVTAVICVIILLSVIFCTIIQFIIGLRLVVCKRCLDQRHCDSDVEQAHVQVQEEGDHEDYNDQEENKKRSSETLPNEGREEQTTDHTNDQLSKAVTIPPLQRSRGDVKKSYERTTNGLENVKDSAEPPVAIVKERGSSDSHSQDLHAINTLKPHTWTPFERTSENECSSSVQLQQGSYKDIPTIAQRNRKGPKGIESSGTRSPSSQKDDDGQSFKLCPVTNNRFTKRSCSSVQPEEAKPPKYLFISTPTGRNYVKQFKHADEDSDGVEVD